MRAFASINVPEDIRKMYSKLCRGMRDAADMSIVLPNKLHITLAFFSNLSSVERLQETMREVDFKPFTIKCTRLAKFDRRGITSVIYVDTECDELKSYAETFRSKLEQHKITIDDKVFKPHITIARIKEITDDVLFSRMFNGACHGFKPQEFLVDNLSIMSSNLVTYREIFNLNFTIAEEEVVEQPKED